MGRGVSSGGGQSSLGYLFGSGESHKKAQVPSESPRPANNNNASPTQKIASASALKPIIDEQIPAGIHGTATNNYFRTDGQNCGNFITDRPSTKVHAAPGGGSSLGYLFGGGNST